MKEEDQIIKTAGSGNPFTVPEGYFENLTEKIMEQLPPKEEAMPEKTPGVWDKIRPWLYMAAMFIAILLPIRFMIQHTRTTGTTTLAAKGTDEGSSIDEFIDYAILDHTMMDDYTLYQYIMEDNPEDFN